MSNAQTGLDIMKFEYETYNLGPINKGEKREFSYTFTNVGKEDIQIDLVSGCDCTTLDWTRLPIKPSGTGTIEVIFDSTEKEDSESVDIDIYLKNINPKTGHPILKIIDYSFQLVKE
jgi:peptidoglycan-associated lipoprotein